MRSNNKSALAIIRVLLYPTKVIIILCITTTHPFHLTIIKQDALLLLDTHFHFMMEYVSQTFYSFMQKYKNVFIFAPANSRRVTSYEDGAAMCIDTTL